MPLPPGFVFEKLKAVTISGTALKAMGYGMSPTNSANNNDRLRSPASSR